MTPLEIVVTGNTSQATSGLQAVQAELGKTAIAAQKTDSSIDKASLAFTNLANSGTKSLFILNEKLRELQSVAFTEKDTAKIASYNSQIQSTEKEILQLSNAGKTGFTALGDAVAKTGNPLTQAFSAIRKLAYILPGVGVAGIIGFATDPILNYIESLDLFGQKTKEEKENADKLANATKSIFESSGKEGEQVVSLIAVLKSETETRERKLAAIKELQKISPEVFSQLRIEKGEVIGLDTAYQSYLTSLKTVIASKILQAQLDQKITQLVKAQGVETSTLGKNLQQGLIDKLTKDKNFDGLARIADDSRKSAKEVDKLNFEIEDLRKRLTDLSKGITIPGVNAEGGRLKQIDDQIKDLKKQKELHGNTIDEIKNFNSQIKTLQDERDLLDPKIKKPKTISSGKEFEIDLDSLQRNYEGVQKVIKKTYDANLADAKDNGIVVEDALLNAQINFLTKKEALLIKFNKSDFENFRALEEAKQKLLDRNVDFSKGPNKDDVFQKIQFTLPPADELQKEVNKELTAKINPVKKVELSAEAIVASINLDTLIDKLNKAATITTDVLGPAFDALFTSIATGSGHAFEAFGQAVLKSIEQMAVAIAKAAALAAIITLIQSSLGIPSTVGLGSFSKIFSSLLGIKGFAGGVNNFSGGLAVVGEQGPELVNLPRGSSVIPNNQISGSMNNTQVFIPQVVLRGQDMLIMFNRAQQTASRNG